jgi:hypothetical protein
LAASQGAMTARPPPGPEDVDGQIGVGLMAIAEGMSLMRQADGAPPFFDFLRNVYDTNTATPS